ncbi:hypothetical protein JZ751_015835 [Albula glossodonta]|uniref:Uncharacterized protein n=1 Tax=Albula glossodonta TaxID=121402 RepID=A0A8T2N6K7_9TELE|nr:hypothetical protein JZ751_015835 [Albula glossodonta]
MAWCGLLLGRRLSSRNLHCDIEGRPLTDLNKKAEAGQSCSSMGDLQGDSSLTPPTTEEIQVETTVDGHETDHY